MSLRLLQKQVGAESEARRKQLGHGPVAGRKGSGGRGSGSASGANKAPGEGGKGRGKSGYPAAVAEEVESKADQDTSWRSSETEPTIDGDYFGAPGLQRPREDSSRTGKGPGRGKGGAAGGAESFLADFGGESDPAEEQPAAPKQADPREGPPPPPPDTPSAPAVPGLREAMQAASLSKHTEAAEEWCAEAGAVNLEEVLEAIQDLCSSLSLKPLEVRRFEKALRSEAASLQASLPTEAAAAPAASAADIERAEQKRKEAEQERQRLEAEAAQQMKLQQAQEEERLSAEAAEEEKQRREAEDAEQALSELLAAMDAADPVVLSTAVSKAEQAGVGSADISAAKRLVFQLQKERREQAKKLQRIEASLQAALEGDSMEALETALAEAEAHKAAESLLSAARARLAELQAPSPAAVQTDEAVAGGADEVVDDAAPAQSFYAATACAAKQEEQQEAEPTQPTASAAQPEEERQVEPEEDSSATDDGSVALRELKAAMQARDAAALGSSLAQAEKAGVAQQEIAAAKRLVFQLQKEKREAAKKDKGLKEAETALQAAMDGTDHGVLRAAITKAEKANLPDDRIQAAFTRLEELEELQRLEEIRAALRSVEDAISQEDVEAATAALEEARSLDADPDDLEQLEESLSALREKLDPEGEARRRRLEARKSKDKEGKKWNFGGKSKNPLINDRFREHEAELEQRRMLAYRGRGKFRDKEEDAGDEGQEKTIKKQRAEINKEQGFVPPPPKAAPKEGFAYLSASKEESEAPRRITLQVQDPDVGAGVDLHGSWWGMVVDAIDEEPGQPGLRLKDTIIEVSGTSLRELDTEDCEQRFGDLFGDGCVIQVEPHVEAVGVLTSSAKVDVESLKADLDRFSEDWGVDIRVEGASGLTMRIILEGAQSAVKASKPELESLMGFYARPA